MKRSLHHVVRPFMDACERLLPYIEKHRKATGVVIALVLALAMQFLEFHGIFSGAEGKVASAYLRRAAPKSPIDIVTIGIDDDDYANFFGRRSPLDAQAVIGLVNALRQSEARVIGVDLITDSEEYLASNALNEAAKATGGRVVWAAPIASGALQPASFFPWVFASAHEKLAASAGKVLGGSPPRLEDQWGLAVYPTDEDRVVRRLPREWSPLQRSSDERDGDTRIFARVIADVYCEEPETAHDEHCRRRQESHAHESFISFDASQGAAHDETVSTRFACATTTPPCHDWKLKTKDSLNGLKGSIVLLGGTYDASRDFYATPIGERTSGLIINASALRAEILGPPVVEFERLYGYLFDVLLGFGVSLAFLPKWPIKLKVLAGLSLGPAAFFAGKALFQYGILWLSWVGLLLTGLSAHVLIEVLLEGEPAPGEHGPGIGVPRPGDAAPATADQAPDAPRLRDAPVAGAADRGADQNL